MRQLAFGVFSNAGGYGAVNSITWDGVKHVFDRATSTVSVRKSTPVKPTNKNHLTVYVQVTSNGGVVAGDAVTISNSGKKIGTGKVGLDGRVNIKLTKKLAGGKRSLRVSYAGGATSKPSSTLYSVTVKKTK